uniref:Uncharacterized protein n=1 Tax=Abalone herpesvirus Taiwan/2005 TaxID=1821058 RepID=A0A145VUY1_9VIRU|nr:hypothetical protein tc2005_p073 [Abalone herpesvirus Taiwan/2005]
MSQVQEYNSASTSEVDEQETMDTSSPQEETVDESSTEKTAPKKSSKKDKKPAPRFTAAQNGILPTHPRPEMSAENKMKFAEYIQKKKLDQIDMVEIDGMSIRQRIVRKIFEKECCLFELASQAIDAKSEAELKKIEERVEDVRFLNTDQSRRLGSALIKIRNDRMKRGSKRAEKVQTGVVEDTDLCLDKEESGKSGKKTKSAPKKSPAIEKLEKIMTEKKYGEAAIILSMVSIPDYIKEEVREVLVKNEVAEGEPQRCFTCSNMVPVILKPTCCEKSIPMCENCLDGFAQNYSNSSPGRRMKCGFMSCYSCDTMMGYHGEDDKEVSKDQKPVTDMLKSDDVFYAKFLLAVITKHKVKGFNTNQRPLLMAIGSWIQKTLKDQMTIYQEEKVYMLANYGVNNHNISAELIRAIERGSTAEEYFVALHEKNKKKNGNKKNKKSVPSPLAVEVREEDVVPEEAKSEEANSEPMQTETEKPKEKPKSVKRKAADDEEEEVEEPALKVQKVDEETAPEDRKLATPARKPVNDDDDDDMEDDKPSVSTNIGFETLLGDDLQDQMEEPDMLS